MVRLQLTIKKVPSYNHCFLLDLRQCTARFPVYLVRVLCTSFRFSYTRMKLIWPEREAPPFTEYRALGLRFWSCPGRGAQYPSGTWELRFTFSHYRLSILPRLVCSQWVQGLVCPFRLYRVRPQYLLLCWPKVKKSYDNRKNTDMAPEGMDQVHSHFQARWAT